MANSIDVETLLKHYTEGRITKQEFLQLHSLITQNEESIPIVTSRYYPPPVASAEHRKPHGMFHFVKTYLKTIVAFMGSLSILSTLAINYYHNYVANPAQHGPATVQGSQINDTGKPGNPKDINSIAQFLISDPIWDARTVNQFTTQWIALSNAHKEAARKARWFTQFTDTLKKQVKFELARSLDKGSSADTENRQRALMHLVVTLNIIAPEKHPHSLAELDSLLSSGPSVATNVSAANSRHAEAQKAASASATQASASQAAEFAALSPVNRELGKKVNEIIQDADTSNDSRVTSLSSSSNTERTGVNRKAQSTRALKFKPAPKHPTPGELQDIVTQYVEGYQSGDVDRLMQLFAGSNWTKGSDGLSELRNDYSDLFKATSDRQVFITNMDWSFKGNKAMGTGDLVINLLSKSDHKITKKKGKVRMVVEKNDRSLISNLFQIIN